MATNQITQSNVPKSISLDQFKGASDRAGSFARGCRFFVVITPPQSLQRRYPTDLHYMCEATDFPGRGFAIAEARYYGPSQLFPTNSQYQPLTVTLLCRSDCRERRFFDDWLDFINPISTWRFRYQVEYATTIMVYQYPDYAAGSGRNSKSWTPIASYAWRFNRTWPTLVNPQPVTWAEQDVLRLQISFAFNFWDRPTLIGATSDNRENAGTQVASQQTVPQFDVSYNPNG